MSQIEVSPGGVGFIRTPSVKVPGVPETAKRQTWVVSGIASDKSTVKGDFTISRRNRKKTRSAK